MATDVDYIRYFCEQIEGIGFIRFRKMFGEYMVYVNEKPVFLVCDNTVYVKMLPEISQPMKGAQVGIPYPGAKSYYILDIDNGELVREVAVILESVTQLPKPRKKKPI